MQGWRITNHDYRCVLQEPWSGRFPFLFLDPPYAIDGHGLYGDRGSTHTGFGHEEFKHDLEQVQVPTLITYNASRALKRVYVGWRQVVHDLGYSIRSHRRYRRHQRARRELILTNYQ